MVCTRERGLDYSFGEGPQCHQHAQDVVLVSVGLHADSVLGHRWS